MESLAHGSPSPELEAANNLIIAGCKEIRRFLKPEDGRVPKANLKAALHLMAEVLKAHEAMDKANYGEVERLMDWAAPEVSA